MKKIILLLILPFMALMAIDFTMTRDGLIAPSSIDNSSADTNPITTNNTSTDTDDGTVDSTPTSLTVAASETPPANTPPPTADAGSDKTAQINHSITISGSSSDSDGTIVAYEWKKQSNDQVLAITPTFDFTPTGIQAKTLVFTVTNDQGTTASDMMILTVTDSPVGNTPPKADAISTTNTTSTDVNIISTPSTVTSDTNPYLEPIDLPKCNETTNKEIQFIRNKADWSTINSSSKRIFCVSPGDYTSLGNIKLTSSGTKDKRRYIILNNGNDTHPGKLNKSQLANFALDLQAVNYWVIDRASSFDKNFTHSFIIGKNSTHNIFNRLFTQNIFHTMWIKNQTHYNTIQNSRFDGITDKGAAADLATINILDHSTSEVKVTNTKVINNEFVNVKALRLAKAPLGGDSYNHTTKRQTVNYEGTIFYGNNVEFTKSKRTDCSGNFTPNGGCIAMESTALGIKGGSDNLNNPVILSNNHVWGHRKSDPTYEYLSSGGGFGTIYMGAQNIKIYNNVIFDGTSGISLSDRYDAPYGTKNIEVKNNILYDLGKPGKKNSTPFLVGSGVDDIIKDNVIINSYGKWANIWNNTNLYFGNNTIINPAETDILMTGYTPEGMSSNKIYKSAAEAGYTKDYSFTTDKFTNNPRVIVLKNAIKAN